MQTTKRFFRDRAGRRALLLIMLALGMAGCVPASTAELRVTRIRVTPTAGATAVLAQVTAAPRDLNLRLDLSVEPQHTFTPIPTVTLMPPAAAATAAPSPTATPVVTAAPPAPLPNPISLPLPEILPTPTISRSVRVPILMYHYISIPPEDADQYRINLSVPPERFREQMAYLAQNGYTVIDLYQLIEALVRQTELPPRPVVLTFDDGYADNYANAYPILEEFGFKGTFFILPEFVDNGNPNYMTWEMIHEMARAGHRFESHTKNHPDVTTLSRSDLIWQMLGSQETLAYHLGYKPMFFAYPSGQYNQKAIDMLEELNFWAAVTTQGGVWRGLHDRLVWTRTRVSYQSTLEDLAKALVPRNDRPTPVPTATPTP